MLFRMLHDERSGEMSYLLGDADAGEAVLVDPHGRDLIVWRAVLNERELRLRWVLSLCGCWRRQVILQVA